MSEYPHIRQVGRYLFYGLCAFGFSLLFLAVCRGLHVPKPLTEYITMAALLISFLALRDIEKNAEARGRASLPHPKERT